MITVQYQNYSPQFQGFKKVKGTHAQIKKISENLKDKYPDSFVLVDRKNKKENVCYIITKKHQDKFLDVLKKNNMIDIKENLEKYMNEKAKEISFEKIQKLIKKDKI